MKNQIIENCKKLGSSYVKSIVNGKTHKFDDIWNWLDGLFPVLKGRSKAEKLFWLVYGIKEFPVCENCGTVMDKPRQFKNFKNGYRRFCCKKCSATASSNDPSVQAKCRHTKKKRYGDAGWNNHDKACQTKLDRYGNPNWNNPEKTKNTCLEKYGSTSPLHNKEISSKIRRENLEKFGSEYVVQSEHFKKKRVKTCREHYGVSYPMQSDVNKEKRRQTSLERYGVEFPTQNESIKEKAKATNIRKYGGNSSMNSKAVQEKARLTNIERHGCDWPAQNREIFLKQKFRYMYDGMSFDSKPEIALYVWLKDTGANFEYQPSKYFTYEFNGKAHKYFPDFRIGEKFYEIKGDHMLSEFGDWICPWDRSQDAAYNAKGKCAAENDIIVLTKKDYQKYVDYVKTKYGKDWLD